MDLPSELYRSIFALVDDVTLVKSMRVCNRWRRCVLEELLQRMRTLHFQTAYTSSRYYAFITWECRDYTDGTLHFLASKRRYSESIWDITTIFDGNVTFIVRVINNRLCASCTMDRESWLSRADCLSKIRPISSEYPMINLLLMSMKNGCF